MIAGIIGILILTALLIGMYALIRKLETEMHRHSQNKQIQQDILDFKEKEGENDE